MNVAGHIAGLDAVIGQPSRGLPQDVFFFVSRLTPLVNVDLLIRNDQGETLLTWRHDEFHGPGWHIPGGILRFKESLADRIAVVAKEELGCVVECTRAPVALHEIMAPYRDVRGHFISLLFECRLSTGPDPALKFTGEMPLNGQWQWFSRCPHELIHEHDIYRPYVDGCPPSGREINR